MTESAEQQLVTFEVAGQKLEGLITKADSNGPFSILLLGGGGNIPHQQYYGAWQEHLATIGVSSMSFDFRGVGASDGKLNQSSLDTRLEDARAAVELLKQRCPNEKLYITGISMGGTIAIQLANEVGADGLVLIAPAAYSKEARHKQFGPEFSEAIRKELSWKDSPDFDQLMQFEGKVLLAYGDKDNVIPAPILQRYAGIARGKGEVLVISGVGHRFMREGDAISLAARNKVQASLVKLANMLK